MKKILKVNKKLAAKVQAFLDEDKPVPDAGLDEVMYTLTAVFDERMEADIKFCNGDTGPYIDAVLFDKGSEVHVLEPSTIFLGEYPFEYQGVAYVVEVEEK